MSKYNHYNVPKKHKQRQEQFIKWCVENITEWKSGHKAVVSRTRRKFSTYHWVERCDSMCYWWSVCTRKHYEEYKAIK